MSEHNIIIIESVPVSSPNRHNLINNASKILNDDEFLEQTEDGTIHICRYEKLIKELQVN